MDTQKTDKKPIKLTNGQLMITNSIIQIANMIEDDMRNAPPELKTVALNTIVRILWPELS